MTTSIETVNFRGQECLRLHGDDGAAAVVSLHGAHVLSWIPADGVERLFLSERAAFDGKAAIRGGVPVCFPQFSGLGDLPKHGLVRTRDWHRGADSAAPGQVRAELEVRDDGESRALWPHAFRLRLSITLAPASLKMALEVANTGAAGFEFTGALHTYLRVGDIAAATVSGLQGLEYRDSASGNAIRREAAAQLVFDREVDRVYHAANQSVEVRDGARVMSVSASGFADVVVWNPWAALSAALPDMAPDGYRNMLCIEAGAVQFPVALGAGERWVGSQTLTRKD